MTQKRHVGTITKVTPIMADATSLSGYTVEQDCGHTFVGVPHAQFPIGDKSICGTHDDDCDCYYCQNKGEKTA